MTTAQEGVKVVSLTHRPHLPQEFLLVLISVRLSRQEQAKYSDRALTHFVSPLFCFRTMSVGRKLGASDAFIQQWKQLPDSIIQANNYYFTIPTV